MEKTHNPWKISTYILIITLIISWLIFIGVMNIGYNYAENEANCAENICIKQEADSYYYDDYESMCYCYEQKEIIYSEKI